VASTTYSIRLDGTRQAIGPFPFTVRGITLQNRCVAGNLFAVDDRGSQQEATPLTAVNSKAEDTTYITCYIDSPQTSGSLTIIVSDTEPSTPIETSQLSTLGGQAGSVIVPTVALGSFPPSSPQDGQLVSLILPSTYDPVGGRTIRWLCEYDATLAMWHVKGPALYAEVQTVELAPNSGSYGDAATVGPAVTLPRPGDWISEHGFLAQDLSTPVLMSYQIGGIGALDADAIQASTGNAQTNNTNKARIREKVNLTAVTVTAKYKCAGGVGNIGNRYLAMRPLRIT
jgi:hypothetical protein